MAEEGEGGEGGEVNATVVKLFIKAIDELTEPIENAEKSLRGLIGDVREAAASSIELFAGYEMMEKVIEPAGEMQEKLTDLRIATGMTAEAVQEFKEKAEDMSTSFGVNAEDMVSAQTILARTFGETEKALAASDTVAKYALVTHISATSAAQGLSAAYEAIGNKTVPFKQGLEDVADRLTYLTTKFNLSGMSAESFARMFANIAGQAQQFHLPLDQLEGIAATLSRTGYQGARAVMLVREAMNTVFGGSKGFAEGWSKAGLSIGKDWDKNLVNFIATLENADTKQHAAFEHFVQSHGQAGIVLENLVHHLDEWKEATHGVAHAQGLLNKDADLAAKNWKTVYADFANEVSNFADAIGTELLPYLTRFVRDLTDAFVAVQKFSEAHPYIMDLIAGFVALVALLTTLAGLFGAVVGYLALMSTSLVVLGTSIGAIFSFITGLGLIIAAFAYLVYNNWNTIVRVWEWGVNQIHDLMQWWTRFVNDPWDVTKTTWESGKSWLASTMENIGRTLSFTQQHPLQALSAIWSGIKKGVLDISQWIGNLTLGGIITGEGLALRFGGLWGGVAYNILIMIGLIIDHWSDFMNWFAHHLPAISKEVDSVVSQIEKAFNSAAKSVKDAWESVKQMFNDVFTWIGDKVEWLVGKFDDLTKFLTNLTHFGGYFGASTGIHNGGVAVPTLPNSVIGPVPRSANPPSNGLYHPSAFMGGNFHYSPQANVYMQGGGDPDSVRAAVQQVMDDNKEDFAQQMEDYMMNNRRKTFNDLSYNL